MSATPCTAGRACDCVFHQRRRACHREYARRKREARLAATNFHAQRCQRRAGSGICDARLETSVGEFGRTVVTCPACDRRKRGVCRDCPQPVEGRVGTAMRCAKHKDLARQAQMRASEERHHEERLAAARESYQSNEEFRRRRNEYKRAWRKANREKVAEQKRRYIARHSDDPNSAYNRYHARYRKRHQLHYREIQNTRNAIERAGWTPPLCTKCGKKTGWEPLPGGKSGSPWKTCMKCCRPHQRKERRRVRRERQRAIAKDPNFGKPQRPVKVRRPAAAAQRGPGWERLCLTPGCDVVVTHRKKKCTKCRRAAAELAEAKLAAHRGRGRRTDLERVA